MQSSSDWLGLAGSTALVTGAGSGIGRAVTVVLAQAGVRVLATDLDQTGLEVTASEAGTAVDTLTLDVTSEAQWQAVVSWLEQHFETLNILVNCAGIALGDSVCDESLEAYRKTFGVNVEGTLLGMKTALHFMRQKGQGSIINFSSTASLQANPHMAAYGASKAAVAHYTKSAAVKEARSGNDIRVNAIHPGLIDTSMADDLYEIQSALGSPEEIVKKITTGRTGNPEEVANLVLFLASDRASFISGTSINIDRAASA